MPKALNKIPKALNKIPKALNIKPKADFYIYSMSPTGHRTFTLYTSRSISNKHLSHKSSPDSSKFPSDIISR